MIALTPSDSKVFIGLAIFILLLMILNNLIKRKEVKR